MNEAIDAIEKNEIIRLKSLLDEALVRARDTRGESNFSPLVGS